MKKMRYAYEIGHNSIAIYRIEEDGIFQIIIEMAKDEVYWGKNKRYREFKCSTRLLEVLFGS